MEFLTIEYPNAGETIITGVNNDGQAIVRIWGNGDHGFLATPVVASAPVSEPLTLLLLSSGISGIIIYKKKFYRKDC